MPDSHAHTRIVGGVQAAVDGFDAIVAARRTARLEFDAAELEVHVVVDDDDVVGVDAVIVANRGDGVA